MTNTITQKQLKQMQHKYFYVIAFDRVTNRRTITYGNQSYKDAIETIIKYQSYGNICILIKDEDLPIEEVSWNFNDYIKYIDNQVLSNPKVDNTKGDKVSE